MSSANFVLENHDLLREIGNYIDPKLPFVLSSKTIRDALKPMNTNDQVWIFSNKGDFVESIPLVQWAESQGCIFSKNFHELNNDYTLCTYASNKGKLDILQWIFSSQELTKQHPINEASFVAGIKYGSIELLEFLRTRVEFWRLHYCDFACITAAKYGHFEILKWLLAQDPPFQFKEESFSTAVANGNLQMLEWLRSQDPPFPWSSASCTVAAAKGDLEILIWLRSQDPPCPWGVGCCFSASLEGRFETLKWLRSQEPPCPWVKHNCIEAASNFPEMLSWILNQEEGSDDEQNPIQGMVDAMIAMDDDDDEFYDYDLEFDYDDYDYDNYVDDNGFGGDEDDYDGFDYHQFDIDDDDDSNDHIF